MLYHTDAPVVVDVVVAARGKAKMGGVMAVTLRLKPFSFLRCPCVQALEG